MFSSLSCKERQNVLIEFPELSPNLIKRYEKTFTRYDTDNDGYLDVEDLKGMMMVRGVPWTHSAIIRLIRDADEDGDGKLSFREVGRAMSLENRDAATGNDGLTLLAGARDAFKWLTRDTVDTSHKVMWGVGRFLLSTGESVNFVWDVALNSLVNLLKTGGAAYGAIADRVADVPVIGYGAGGIGEAIRTSLSAVESTARHDTETRKRAFAELNAKLNESGSRLSGRASGTVVFPTD